jgi:hypothetical protein
VTIWKYNQASQSELIIMWSSDDGPLTSWHSYTESPHSYLCETE